MAVISKIRNNVWLIILVIGLSMGAFILTDVVRNFDSIIRGNQTSVGEVDGKSIDYNEFEKKVQQAIDNYTRQGMQIDDSQRGFVVDQVWESLVTEMIYASQSKKTGVDVSGDEVYQMFTNDKNPNPTVVQVFTQGQKPFDVNEVKRILKQAETDPATAAQLKDLEEYLIKARVQEKINFIVNNSIFVSKAEAKRKYMEDNTKCSIEYLGVNYATEADSLYTVSESDYSKYYNEHREEFKQEKPEAILKYVTFMKVASGKDSLELRMEMAKIADEFKSTKDDSTFAASKSDAPVDYTFKPLDKFDPQTKELIQKFKSKRDTVFYSESNVLKLVKICGERNGEAAVDFNHILVRDSAKAEDVYKQAKGDKSKFGMLAAMNSDDQQSKFQGGTVNYFKNMYGQEFDSLLQKTTTGSIVKIKGNDGFHICEIKNKTTLQYRIAVITKEITPSNQTLSDIERTAMTFRSKMTSSENFDKLAAQNGLDLRTSPSIMPGSGQIPGINGVKELLKWTLTGNKKQLSDVVAAENAFVVCYIDQKFEAGYKTLDDIKETIKPKVLATVKSKKIMEKMASLSGTDLEQMKGKYGVGAYVNKADNVSFANPMVPGLGNDGKLVGKIFKLKANEVSKPIAANSGVYIIKVTKIEAPEKVDDKVLEDFQKNLLQSKKGQFQNKLATILKDNAKIVDNRYKFGY